MFPLKIWEQSKNIPLLFNIVLEVLEIRPKPNKEKKEKKKKTVKEEVKLSLFSADKMVYIENPRKVYKMPIRINK